MESLSYCRLPYAAGPVASRIQDHIYHHRLHGKQCEISKLYKSWPSFTRLHSQWNTNFLKSQHLRQNRSWCAVGEKFFFFFFFLALHWSHPSQWFRKMKSFTENTFNSDWSASLLSLYVSLKPGCLIDKATHRAHFCGCETKIYSVAEAESTAEVLWWEVKSMWVTLRWPFHSRLEWNTVLKAK